jgi:antitoxin component YwqK of YwqJK toxin-antitoxin module
MNQNGKMDGLYESWYDNGNPELKIYYTNSVKNGLYESYDYAGQILCKCTYEDGHLIGLYQQWYENGQLREESIYGTDGYRNGLSTIYHDNGQMRSQAMYVDGSLEGTDNRWYKSGVQYVQSFCIKGVDVGEWKKWGRDGN